MLTEDQFISYFEKIATAHPLFAHDAAGIKSFFEVEDPEELTSFDAALRSTSASTVMLLVSGEGELDDNDSNNHLQAVEVQIYILQKLKTGITIPAIRSTCMQALVDILGFTKKAARENKLVPGKTINFRIEKVPVRKVGPMNLNWYGYTALLTFTCPFGWKLDSGTWTDIL